MDEPTMRALLTVMNVNAPQGTEWCAWAVGAEFWLTGYDIRDRWGLYLVGGDSPWHGDDSGDLIWGNR